MDLKKQALKELAIRELEKRYQIQRESLIEYMRMIQERELKGEFVDNWHMHKIADVLKEVQKGAITRLIINMPPRHFKTEIITKSFPTFWLGHNPKLEVIATGYATSLTQTFSGQARDMYTSETYSMIFPRKSPLREDQNTKEWWVNEDGGGYYATGTAGSITGRGANLFLVDDPIKPDEAAKSDIVRIGVNNWYDNTVHSRLNNPMRDAVVLVMQRTHQQDLSGYLIDKMKNGAEKWEVLSLPAIAELDEEYRKEGEALMPSRVPLEALLLMKKSNPVGFSTQYQQRPIAKESQEFHEELFRYYEEIPSGGRIFTAVDPAFKTNQYNDESAIITGKFIEDRLYILEITHGRFEPPELEDKIVYHIRKWQPEKCGVEAVQAQVIINYSLANRLRKEGLNRTLIEDIAAKGKKEERIRGLISLFANGLIYFTHSMNTLEEQLISFPRGAHDDIIDALAMLYKMYELQPNVHINQKEVKFKRDAYGRYILA